MKQPFIPLSVPKLNGKELEYVTHAIETEWVSSGGGYVTQFENDIADYVKSTGAVACQNGTAGLHIALELCGVNQENEVIVPTLTFIAAVNPIRYVGSNPIFMDCDDSLCLDAEKLATFCEQECQFNDGKLINNQTNKHIKAVVIVHVFGNMANMEAIMPIAKQYNLSVIEDATEALGTYYTAGKYKGRYAGTIGAIGIYSFNGNKIITTGGGGMIVSNNNQLLKKAKHLTTQAKTDDVYYTHDAIGYNYRMTNVQAAIGVAQLEQLEEFIEVKQQNYNQYQKDIGQNQKIKLLTYNHKTRWNYWFYTLYLIENDEINRDELIQYLAQKSIQTRPIWALINEQLPYKDSQTYRLEKAKKYVQKCINIPCSSSLTSQQVERVIMQIKERVGC